MHVSSHLRTHNHLYAFHAITHTRVKAGHIVYWHSGSRVTIDVPGGFSTKCLYLYHSELQGESCVWERRKKILSHQTRHSRLWNQVLITQGLWDILFSTLILKKGFLKPAFYFRTSTFNQISAMQTLFSSHRRRLVILGHLPNISSIWSIFMY